jgi:Fic family protein
MMNSRLELTSSHNGVGTMHNGGTASVHSLAVAEMRCGPPSPAAAVPVSPDWPIKNFDASNFTATPRLHIPRNIVWEPNVRRWNEFAKAISDEVSRLGHDASMRGEANLFAAAQLAVVVLDSNRLEGTAAIDGSTLTLIQTFIAGGDGRPKNDEWHEEGDRDPSSASTANQLSQFCAAAIYTHSPETLSRPLSIELILEVHAIIMKGSTLGEYAGRLRTDAICAGGRGGTTHVFVDPDDVKQALLDTFQEYNSAVWHPVQRASYLLYELLTIHPFKNGNGRLARLMLSWSLRRDGFPFAVALSSGHRAARAHYLHAIERARGNVCGAHKTLAELNAMVLVSLSRVFANLDDHPPVDENSTTPFSMPPPC